MLRSFLYSALTLILVAPVAWGADVRVAVASNFLYTAERLAEQFTQQTGYEVQLSSGSTGKLYTQIISGAPYDHFMSADAARAQRLADEGSGARDTLTTYAFGELVLWIPQDRNESNADAGPVELTENPLLAHNVERLAIANPRTAPYGLAAVQALENMDLMRHYRSKLVRGENITQTYQLVFSGAAQAGLVALSQFLQKPSGSYWLVPGELYAPIEQQMIVLKSALENEAVLAWHNFVLNEGAGLISNSGYQVGAERR